MYIFKKVYILSQTNENTIIIYFYYTHSSYHSFPCVSPDNGLVSVSWDLWKRKSPFPWKSKKKWLSHFHHFKYEIIIHCMMDLIYPKKYRIKKYITFSCSSCN